MKATLKSGRFTESAFQEKYRDPEKRKKLSWHHERPTAFLKEATAARGKVTTALDIGCGLGTDAVFLAQQGWNVTAIDFVGDAVEATKKRANDAGVKATCIQADIFTWSCTDKFDLIVDAGCMHNIDRSRLSEYRRKVLGWLSDDAEFILAHWEKRHVFDWRPEGPHRVSKDKIERFLAPELKLKDFQRRVVHGLPFKIGPTLSIGFYWFQRA
jgi:SAM-dependent methyltransferase